MRDDEFSSKFLANFLREEAKTQAKADDFGHPEEYTLWMAANRLEDLEEIVACLNPEGNPSATAVASLLKRIAGSIEWGHAHHKYSYTEDIKDDGAGSSIG
jgi:hypothetical protein